MAERFHSTLVRPYDGGSVTWERMAIDGMKIEDDVHQVLLVALNIVEDPVSFVVIVVVNDTGRREGRYNVADVFFPEARRRT